MFHYYIVCLHSCCDQDAFYYLSTKRPLFYFSPSSLGAIVSCSGISLKTLIVLTTHNFVISTTLTLTHPDRVSWHGNMLMRPCCGQTDASLLSCIIFGTHLFTHSFQLFWKRKCYISVTYFKYFDKLLFLKCPYLEQYIRHVSFHARSLQITFCCTPVYI